MKIFLFVYYNNVSFYDKINFQKIKELEMKKKYWDLKPFKLDENRIIIIEKIIKLMMKLLKL